MAAVVFNPLPTREQILSFLDYDPATGIFRWKETRKFKKKGAVAGSTDKRTGYIRIGLNGVAYAAHRLSFVVATGRSDIGGLDIDHMNGIKSDNRPSNLRAVDRSKNSHNALPLRHNTSGYRGVQWRPYNQKWIAKITVRNKIYHLGTFETKEEAIAARLSAEARFGIKRYVVSSANSRHVQASFP